MAHRNHIRSTFFVDQFESEDLWSPPNPETEYQLTLESTDRNVSLLMKLILLSSTHPEVLPRIRELCADPIEANARTPKGITPIMLATMFSGSYGNLDIMRWLLQTGVSPEEFRFGDLGLLDLAMMNVGYGYAHPDGVKLLLEFGVDATRQKSIHTAFQYDNLEALQLLLQLGASLDTSIPGDSPWLHLAAANHSHRVMADLLSRGVDIEAVNDSGFTALLVASWNGNVDGIQMLLAAGANIDSVDAEGKSGLLLASRNNHSSIIQILLQAGANLEQADARGYTPLSWAAINHQIEPLRILIAAGANLEHQDWGRATVLIRAANDGWVEGIQELLSAGVQDRSRGLLQAVITGQRKVAQLLVAAGADLKMSCSEGRSLIQLAISHDRPKMVRWLIQQGADPAPLMNSKALPSGCNRLVEEFREIDRILHQSLTLRCLKACCLAQMRIVIVSTEDRNSKIIAIQNAGGTIEPTITPQTDIVVYSDPSHLDLTLEPREKKIAVMIWERFKSKYLK